MRRSSVAALSLGFACALQPRPARADSFGFTRSERLVERAHRIEMLLHRGHADLTVQRDVHNGGERSDQAIFGIDLPDGAVATGLRTRARVNGVDTWFRGELLEAELAAARYGELTGFGGAYPKDPALLSWRGQGALRLQVFPCPVGEEKAVEYSVRVPSTWKAGRDVFELPALGTSELPASTRVRAGRSGDRIYVDGKPWPARKPLIMDVPHRIELEPGTFQGPVEGELAVVPFGKRRVLFQLHLDVAPRLSTVPHGAAVVVLIDASRSIRPEDLAASQLAAQAYLTHFEGKSAKVAVVAFDRAVRRVTRGFVDARGAIASLETPLARRNGSALDAALAHADALLATVPGDAPRRVILLSDLLPRRALTARSVVRPSGAVLHAAIVREGSQSNDRDDLDRWATLPRSTGGVLWRASAPVVRWGAQEAKAREQLRAQFESWARPIRLDHVAITTGHKEAPVLDKVPATLDEGEGLVGLRVHDRQVGFASFTAELWSAAVNRVLVPDEKHGLRWAGLVFGSPVLGELQEAEMTTLARAGGVVSPVTSYLAIEPGVRPSLDGLEEGNLWGDEIGESFGVGGVGLAGYGGGVGSSVDLEALLRALLRDGVRACGASGAASIAVEATLAEIVDVNVSVAGDDARRSKTACVREAAWSVELPATFDSERAHFVTTL